MIISQLTPNFDTHYNPIQLPKALCHLPRSSKLYNDRVLPLSLSLSENPSSLSRTHRVVRILPVPFPLLRRIAPFLTAGSEEELFFAVVVETSVQDSFQGKLETSFDFLDQSGEVYFPLFFAWEFRGM